MRHYGGHFVINWHHDLSFWKKVNLPYSNHLVPLIVFSMFQSKFFSKTEILKKFFQRRIIQLIDVAGLKLETYMYIQIDMPK